MFEPTSTAPIDAPAFDPVPTTPRHDGWTPDRQRRFIEALATLGAVAKACRAVGLSTASAYKLRDRPDAESFAAAWHLALQMGRDRVWERAMDRALNGYIRSTRYRGEVTGYRHVFDNRLAFALAYGALDRPIGAKTHAVSRASSSTSADPAPRAPRIRSRR